MREESRPEAFTKKAQDAGEARPEQMALASKPFNKNHIMKSADKGYKITFPPNCRKFMLQARTDVDLRLAWERGAVADTTQGRDYWTLKAGDVYYEDDLSLEGDIILYIACATAATVVETSQWRQ